mmetsp:Transcript_9111/g.25651  ORF Transcript_9111/g.25651 Transcript_9111/m.25651 type:complete len:260 (+) Transcript_9111:1447-2226(+)
MDPAVLLPRRHLRRCRRSPLRTPYGGHQDRYAGDEDYQVRRPSHGRVDPRLWPQLRPERSGRHVRYRRIRHPPRSRHRQIDGPRQAYRHGAGQDVPPDPIDLRRPRRRPRPVPRRHPKRARQHRVRRRFDHGDAAAAQLPGQDQPRRRVSSDRRPHPRLRPGLVDSPPPGLRYEAQPRRGPRGRVGPRVPRCEGRCEGRQWKLCRRRRRRRRRWGGRLRHRLRCVLGRWRRLRRRSRRGRREDQRRWHRASPARFRRRR